MGRFDKSMGSAHAPGCKEGQHFAENEIRKMKKIEITRDSSRFTLLEDYKSQDVWTSPSISSHPLEQCMFLSDDFRPTLCVGVSVLKMSEASLVHVAPLGTPSCNPQQRQDWKVFGDPSSHVSSLIQAVCSSLAKPQLKTWEAAERQLWHCTLSSPMEPVLSKSSPPFSVLLLSAKNWMSRTGFRYLQHNLHGELVGYESSAKACFGWHT